jgi:hypothetical protein
MKRLCELIAKRGPRRCEHPGVFGRR